LPGLFFLRVLHNEARAVVLDGPRRREAASPVMLSSSRMLPDHEYPIPQREPLIGIIRNRCVHRGVSDRHACRRRDHISLCIL
jgi:hypothetical protein